MINTDATLYTDLCKATCEHPFWRDYLSAIATEQLPAFRIHLAIFVEPYLQYVLDGKKTVESRFSTRRLAPYHHVSRGDVVLLKQSGGPIVGICQVAQVWFYQLDPGSWEQIRKEFTDALCAQDPTFWEERSQASFATLMRVRQVTAITPVKFTKRDRRGWVVLHPVSQQLGLEL